MVEGQQQYRDAQTQSPERFAGPISNAAGAARSFPPSKFEAGPEMNRTIAISGATFRRVLGNYPTGVCVVTAVENDGTPVGLTVGTFTSVSLDPALVAFLPDKRSSTWMRIQRIGRFCVNVLSNAQIDVCRSFSQKGNEKFLGRPFHLSPNGSPILEGVVAWIDCALHDVIDAGDHVIAIGAVVELDAADETQTSATCEPLIFFRGKFCRPEAIE